MPSARGNAFLIAAVALPLIVVGFFLLAMAVPRWTVDPPAHDLILSVDESSSYSQRATRRSFEVRNGQVVAIQEPVSSRPSIEQGETAYLPDTGLIIVDHETQEIRELAVVPAPGPEPPPGPDEPASFVVADLARRSVVAGDVAPDGYAFEMRTWSGPGLMGEIFGMRSRGVGFALTKDGRVVSVELRTERYVMPRVVGWIVDNGAGR